MRLFETACCSVRVLGCSNTEFDLNPNRMILTSVSPLPCIVNIDPQLGALGAWSLDQGAMQSPLRSFDEMLRLTSLKFGRTILVADT